MLQADGRISNLKLAESSHTRRWPLFPNTPTFSEQGYPLDLVGWNGIVTAKGTPKAAVDRMSQEINKILQSPEGRKKILDLGLLATGSRPVGADSARTRRGGLALGRSAPGRGR